MDLERIIKDLNICLEEINKEQGYSNKTKFIISKSILENKKYTAICDYDYSLYYTNMDLEYPIEVINLKESINKYNSEIWDAEEYMDNKFICEIFKYIGANTLKSLHNKII